MGMFNEQVHYDDENVFLRLFRDSRSKRKQSANLRYNVSNDTQKCVSLFKISRYDLTLLYPPAPSLKSLTCIKTRITNDAKV